MELLCFPKEIQQAVQRFRSHPATDAVRRTIELWGEHSGTLPTDDAYPEANTFYIYFFTCTKLERVMEAMRHIQEFAGGRVRVYEFFISAQRCGPSTTRPSPTTSTLKVEWPFGRERRQTAKQQTITSSVSCM